MDALFIVVWSAYTHIRTAIYIKTFQQTSTLPLIREQDNGNMLHSLRLLKNYLDIIE